MAKGCTHEQDLILECLNVDMSEK